MLLPRILRILGTIRVKVKATTHLRPRMTDTPVSPTTRATAPDLIPGSMPHLVISTKVEDISMVDTRTTRRDTRADRGIKVTATTMLHLRLHRNSTEGMIRDRVNTSNRGTTGIRTTRLHHSKAVGVSRTRVAADTAATGGKMDTWGHIALLVGALLRIKGPVLALSNEKLG